MSIKYVFFLSFTIHKVTVILSSWPLVILDVARCYLWLFTLYINIKISKNSC